MEAPAFMAGVSESSKIRRFSAGGFRAENSNLAKEEKSVLRFFGAKFCDAEWWLSAEWLNEINWPLALSKIRRGSPAMI